MTTATDVSANEAAAGQTYRHVVRFLTDPSQSRAHWIVAPGAD
jgi:hypothetical protein